MAVVNRYTVPDKFYINTTEDFGFPPYNSTRDTLPERPWKKKWPQYIDEAWVLVEDHRDRKVPAFAVEDEQDGTDFWLAEDDHNSQPRRMHHPGPLPSGAKLTKPEQPLNEAKALRIADINAAHDQALMGAIALPSPTPTNVAVESSLLAATDLEGLEFILNTLQSQKEGLIAEVLAASTLGDIQGIQIKFSQ